MSTWPRWALISGFAAAIFVALGTVGAIGHWAGRELSAATETNHHQSADIRNLETRVGYLEDSRREINAKLDRILERLP